jgi:hypothetical protein
MAGRRVLAHRKEKSQKFDEGVPRASDWRSRLELLESASPIAFAEHPHFGNCNCDAILEPSRLFNRSFPANVFVFRALAPDPEMICPSANVVNHAPKDYPIR